MKKRFIITEEERHQIRGMYNLITEATEEEIKKMFLDRYRKTYFPPSTKYTEEGGKYYATFFGKRVKSTVKYDLDGNVVYIDGLLKGRENTVDADDEIILKKRSPNEEKMITLIKDNLPCLVNPYIYYLKLPALRQTSDGDLLFVYKQDFNGGVVYVNPAKKTFHYVGGRRDGRIDKIECDSEGKIKVGDNVKADTTKKVTEITAPYYFSDATKEKPIIYGMRDKEIGGDGVITKLQEKLKELGHYTGTPDGQFGPLTYQAVIAFQKANKDADGNPLKPDGKVGPKTIQALGLTD